jgi:hypothetical protein
MKNDSLTATATFFTQNHHSKIEAKRPYSQNAGRERED